VSVKEPDEPSSTFEEEVMRHLILQSALLHIIAHRFNISVEEFGEEAIALMKRLAGEKAPATTDAEPASEGDA